MAFNNLHFEVLLSPKQVRSALKVIRKTKTKNLTTILASTSTSYDNYNSKTVKLQQLKVKLTSS